MREFAHNSAQDRLHFALEMIISRAQDLINYASITRPTNAHQVPAWEEAVMELWASYRLLALHHDVIIFLPPNVHLASSFQIDLDDLLLMERRAIFDYPWFREEHGTLLRIIHRRFCSHRILLIRRLAFLGIFLPSNDGQRERETCFHPRRED